MSQFQSVQITPEEADKVSASTATGKPPVPNDRLPNDTVGNSEGAAKPTKPEWLPEKFWKDGVVDQEGLAKSYAELERQHSKPKPEQTPEEKKSEGEQKTDPTDLPPETTEKLKPFTEEFDTQGNLSDESFTKLEAMGYPRDMVESYIAGVQARAKAHNDQVYAAVGGEQQYAELVQWAGKHLSAPEIAAFNAAVESGNPAQAALAAVGLKAKHAQVVGEPASTRVRGSSSGTTVAPFRSTDEVTRAMSDPRYKTDAAFRQEVMDRLRASDVV